jgi:hypothetical protein
MKVLHTRRTAEEHSLKMDRAYVDTATGKTICCWEAADQKRLEELFREAGVIYEAMTVVTEVLETDLK